MPTDRRRLLVAAGAVAAGLLSGCSDLIGPRPTPTETGTPAETPTETETPSTETPTETETESPTPTEEQFDVVDIRDFGAKVDGVTDDTQAFVRALEAVDPDGTVLVPPGVVGVSAHPYKHVAIDIPRPLTGVTISGMKGPETAESRIRMLGGHDHNQTAIRVGGGSVTPKADDGITIRDLVFDGNWSEQVGHGNKFPNAFGLVISGAGQSVLVENCVFENWATNGAIMEADGMTVRDCTFRHNGYGADSVGRDGHGMNAGAEPEGVFVENCLFEDNTGTGIDNTHGKVTVRNSVFVDNQFGIKVDGPSTETVLESCFIDMEGGERGIYTIPGRQDVGIVRLNDVRITNGSWPGIDLPSKARLVGDNIQITNCNQKRKRDGALYVRDGGQFDIGTLSLHWNEGDALHLDDAVGTIETLRYGNNTGDVGAVSRVDIGEELNAEPLTIEIPEPNTVGALVSRQVPFGR